MELNLNTYKHILDNLRDGLYCLNTDRTITYWNRSAGQISGHAACDVMGKRCSDNILVHIDQDGNPLCESACPAAQTMADGLRREAELYLRHKMGYRLPVRTCIDPIFGPDGSVVGAAELFSDISSNMALRRQVDELQQMALFDSLTDIGNRNYALMNLHARFSQKERYGWGFGLLFADIDRFKVVNDTYGHATGDRALKMVAKTLSSNIRALDCACRLGGDEFVIVLVHVDQEALRVSAEKLRKLVEQSAFNKEQSQVRVTISIGAALALDTDTPESLVERADSLMYRSKYDGRNRVTLE